MFFHQNEIIRILYEDEILYGTITIDEENNTILYHVRNMKSSSLNEILQKTLQKKISFKDAMNSIWVIRNARWQQYIYEDRLNDSLLPRADDLD
jgi:hypothetical protein